MLRFMGLYILGLQNHHSKLFIAKQRLGLSLEPLGKSSDRQLLPLGSQSALLFPALSCSHMIAQDPLQIIAVTAPKHLLTWSGRGSRPSRRTSG